MASYRRRMLNFVAYWLQIQRIKRKNAVPTFDEIKAILDAKAKPYAWYDFARTDLTFQGATGQTLADDAGEVVALALSIDTNGAKTIAEVVASQPERRAAGAGTPVGGWTESGAIVTAPASNGTDNVFFPLTAPTVAGRRYLITVPNTMPAGGFYLDFGSGTGSQVGSLGSANQSVILTCTSPGTVIRVGRWTGSPSGQIGPISVKEIPGNHAVQTGAGTLRVVRQADKSCKGDGLDDNLLGTIMGAAAGNSLVALIEAPVTVASTQIISGFNGASNGRFSLGVNAAGMLCAGVGANATTVHVTTFDVRGKTGVAALVEDGTNVKIYWDGNLIYTGARNGAPATTVPYRYWANNNNGTANAFFGGKIFKVIPIQHALNDNEIDWITANMKKVA